MSLNHNGVFTGARYVAKTISRERCCENIIAVQLTQIIRITRPR
jgi:hypothetical protein